MGSLKQMVEDLAKEFQELSKAQLMKEADEALTAIAERYSSNMGVRDSPARDISYLGAASNVWTCPPFTVPRGEPGRMKIMDLFEHRGFLEKCQG